MKFLSFLVLGLFLLSACVPKSDLDEANKKIAELQTQIVAAQAETEKIKAQATAAQAEADRVKVEAERAKNENENLEAQNSQLQAKVDEKPRLPVTVSFRNAAMGPGKVAVFSTTIKSPVPISVTLHSSAFGTDKKFELHLDPTSRTELGHMEGAVIENGDTITIENQNYSAVSVTVSP